MCSDVHSLPCVSKIKYRNIFIATRLKARICTAFVRFTRDILYWDFQNIHFMEKYR